MARWKRIPAVAAMVATIAGAGVLVPLAVQAECRPPQAQPRPHQPVNGTGGFSVFGARTLQKGQFSGGIGYLGEEAVCQQTSGTLDLHTFWVPLAYGITDRLQVGVDIPYSQFQADRAGFDGHGLDDVSAGVVYRLLDEQGPGPALAVAGTVTFPTADKDEGLGTEKVEAGVKFIVSKTFPAGLIGHLNVGYNFIDKDAEFPRRDEATVGVAVEYPITARLSTIGEVLVNNNRLKGQEKHSELQSEGRAGFRFRIADWLLLSLAGRKGFTNDSPNWGAFALLTFEWPPRKAVAAPAPAPAAAPPAAPPPVAAVPPPAAIPPVRTAFPDIHFEFDQYLLTAEARQRLDAIAEVLRENPEFRLLIEGHADERGTVEYNLALGDKRAQAAKEYLVGLGIDPRRLETISYGEERPLDPASNELAWALNRRAHFVVRVGR